MKDDSRWIGRLLGRAAVHTLVGTLATALCGALCVGAAGALTGWALGEADLVGIGGYIGLCLGGGSGAVAGALIFAIRGFTSAPSRSLVPPRRFLLSVGLGQIFATLGVCSGFYALVAADCLRAGAIYPMQFADVVGQHLFHIMFATPILMICGAITGAVIAIRQQKASP